MLDERTQFQLSQYHDGTLPAAERPAVEALLRTSPGARAALEAEARLSQAMEAMPRIPGLDWDQLHAHLSATIDQSAPAARRLAIFPLRWAGRMAVAASVLIAAGLAFLLWPRQAGHPQPQPPALPPIEVAQRSEVEVLQRVEPLFEGPGVLQVMIGPSPSVASTPESWPLTEELVARPARVIIATGASSAHDEAEPLH